MKKATYRFFIKDKQGNDIDIDTLPTEERKEVGRWAYRTMLEAMGYRPVVVENKPEEALKEEEAPQSTETAEITEVQKKRSKAR